METNRIYRKGDRNHDLYRKPYFIIQRLCGHGKTGLEAWGRYLCFFTRNPRGGSAKEIRQEDVDKFLKIAEEGEFGKLVAHAPYTLNAVQPEKKYVPLPERHLPMT